MTALEMNKNNNNRLLVVILILITALGILFFSSCSTEQTCLRERDAYKHRKQTQRDLNYQFNHR